MARDTFNLDGFLPCLLNQAAEVTSRFFQAIYREQHGMTRAQWRVLAPLGKSGALTASEICRLADLEKNKVSQAVAALEWRGHLVRERLARDHRIEALSLTAEGERLFGALGRLALNYDRALRAELGPERTDALIGVLKHLTAAH